MSCALQAKANLLTGDEDQGAQRMKIFLKGFCIVFLCMSLLGLLWFLIIQPGLTNGEAQNLKEEYTQHLPGESSGRYRLGKNSRNRIPLWTLPPCRGRMPGCQGLDFHPGTCVDYPVLQSSADDPEYYLRRTYKANIALPEAFSFSGLFGKQKPCGLRAQHERRDHVRCSTKRWRMKPSEKSIPKSCRPAMGCGNTSGGCAENRYQKVPV